MKIQIGIMLTIILLVLAITNVIESTSYGNTTKEAASLVDYYKDRQETDNNSSQNLAIISIIISSLNTLIIGITAILIWQQIRKTHEWNRKITSQNSLNTLVIGEFVDLRSKLENECNCTIPDQKETYEDVINKASEDEAKEIKSTLSKIVNIFETLGINIKNHTIDEEICYDYLGWIMPEYYRWSLPYIELKREQANDARVLVNFEIYAKKWDTRRKEELEKLKKVGKES